MKTLSQCVLSLLKVFVQNRKEPEFVKGNIRFFNGLGCQLFPGECFGGFGKNDLQA